METDNGQQQGAEELQQGGSASAHAQGNEALHEASSDEAQALQGEHAGYRHYDGRGTRNRKPQEGDSGEDGEDGFTAEQAPLIEADDLRSWILVDNDDVLVVSKPGWVVCHPSKNGPWSSLVGACRELTGIETLHLVARLDRETSGLVIMAKHKAAARRLQMAIERRAVGKEYLAILHGELKEPVRVKQPLAKDLESAIASKVTVRRSNSAKSAASYFEPLGFAGGYTLTKVTLETGRKHQIRAHALWLGHPVAGDKVYGSDETLFLEFIEKGWTDRMQAALPLKRQALHCWQMSFTDVEGTPSYMAPLPQDMRDLLVASGFAALLEEKGI